MPRITEELLRKRAEHNEGRLTTLEEVALHQQEIEKIENLDKLCRHLKILYLQNNIIEKIENVNRLKELEYLNLALNNITLIENLEGCESLKKLDFTANFIDVFDYEISLENLAKCYKLRDLYMTGNPITSWAHYRELTISFLPQLDNLDGSEVTATEKIKSKQKQEELLLLLESEKEVRRVEKIKKDLERQEIKKQKELEKQQKIERGETIEEDKDELQEYTVENRKQMYLDMAKDKEDQDRRKNPEKYKEKKPPTAIKKDDGEMRVCNEGKYEFILKEFDEPEFSSFELKIPKFLDTSLLDVKLFPRYVSVRIKDKLTQIRLFEEIIVEKSTIQRSQITGHLLITMPKLKPDLVLKKAQDRQKETQKKEQQEEEEKQKLSEKIKKDFYGKEINEQELENQQKQQLYKGEVKKVLKTHDDHTFDDIPDLE